MHSLVGILSVKSWRALPVLLLYTFAVFADMKIPCPFSSHEQYRISKSKLSSLNASHEQLHVKCVCLQAVKNLTNVAARIEIKKQAFIWSYRPLSGNLLESTQCKDFFITLGLAVCSLSLPCGANVIEIWFKDGWKGSMWQQWLLFNGSMLKHEWWLRPYFQQDIDIEPQTSSRVQFCFYPPHAS